MSEENMLIIKQINKFGRVLRTPELLKMIEDLEQERDKYKEVIDKAIEYIKSYKIDYSPYELSDYNVRQILEILKGDSNE